MYDFMNSEEFWMNVAIGAAILTSAASLVCVVIGALVAKKAQLTKLGGMIENTDTRIGGMIENTDTRIGGMIENADRGLSKDHDGLLVEIKETKKLAADIKTEILVEKEKDSLKYSSLSDVQKTIVDSVKNLDYMANQLEALARENKLLHQEIRTLTEKVNALELENSRQKEEIIELKMKPPEKRRDRGMER